MSNTLNTPVEALEYTFPIQVTEYRLRKGSGGEGKHRGGSGLVRGVKFLAPATATITSERRRFAPYGLQGAAPGTRGQNTLVRSDSEELLPGKVQLDLQEGDILRIATPGGGGWGSAPQPQEN
jgi:N-methylhydantoinase B